MPFKSTTAFDPNTLELLQRAHEEACLWLTGKDGIGPDEETRTVLALRIIEVAETGEREPQKLKAYALAGLSEILAPETPVPTERSNGLKPKKKPAEAD